MDLAGYKTLGAQCGGFEVFIIVAAGLFLVTSSGILKTPCPFLAAGSGRLPRVPPIPSSVLSETFG
jgi:hypothetical protein